MHSSTENSGATSEMGERSKIGRRSVVARRLAWVAAVALLVGNAPTTASAGTNNTVQTFIRKVAGATIDSWAVPYAPPTIFAATIFSIPLQAQASTKAGADCITLRNTANNQNLACPKAPKKMISIDATVTVTNNPGSGTTVRLGAQVVTSTQTVQFELGRLGAGEIFQWCGHAVCTLQGTWYMDLDDHPELWGKFLTVSLFWTSDNYAGVTANATGVVRVETKK